MLDNSMEVLLDSFRYSLSDPDPPYSSQTVPRVMITSIWRENCPDP
ncbi:MAG TPA: hypothetical protein PKI66_04280 [Methanobacteriaceae archaeon]|nr:hypothetical protein [Euryarchaeota archaeon]HNR25916.1 hypothetical protein [Methanobacteriaceae archaeon]